MDMSDWFVVGIAGVTCGGKTTLSERLCKELPFHVISFHQDDYFLPEDSEKLEFIPELNHANWDILSSLDMDGLTKNVLSALRTFPPTTPAVILIDGNLILNYEPLEQLCNLKYYYVLHKEECRARRKIRIYQPPDGPNSFETCVWPMYQMYKKEVDKMQNIVFLDGEKEKSITFQTVYDDILHKLRPEI